MSDCKHREFESWKGVITCKECGRPLAVVMDDLRANLEATEIAARNACITMVEIGKHRDSLQAQCAVYRQALEAIRGEKICENCVTYTVRARDDREKPSAFCELNPKKYQIGCGSCEEWHADNNAGILAQQALSTTARADMLARVRELEQAVIYASNQYVRYVPHGAKCECRLCNAMTALAALVKDGAGNG